jgi:hypothetical protein
MNNQRRMTCAFPFPPLQQDDDGMADPPSPSKNRGQSIVSNNPSNRHIINTSINEHDLFVQDINSQMQSAQNIIANLQSTILNLANQKRLAESKLESMICKVQSLVDTYTPNEGFIPASTVIEDLNNILSPKPPLQKPPTPEPPPMPPMKVFRFGKLITSKREPSPPPTPVPPPPPNLQTARREHKSKTLVRTIGDRKSSGISVPDHPPHLDDTVKPGNKSSLKILKKASIQQGPSTLKSSIKRFVNSIVLADSTRDRSIQPPQLNSTSRDILYPPIL